MSGYKDIGDWSRWHQEYDDPRSELAGRLSLVQRQVIAGVDARGPEAVAVVSICGGQGREVVGALEHHPRRASVTGRLIELDPENAAQARQWAGAAGMTGFHVVTGDASSSDAYADLAPADLVVISGVFGHLDEADLRRTVAFLTQICQTSSDVIWTSYEVLPERTALLKEIFRANEFEERAFDVTPGGTFGVAVARYGGEPRPLRPGVRIFTFGSSRTG